MARFVLTVGILMDKQTDCCGVEMSIKQIPMHWTKWSFFICTRGLLYVRRYSEIQVLLCKVKKLEADSHANYICHELGMQATISIFAVSGEPFQRTCVTKT